MLTADNCSIAQLVAPNNAAAFLKEHWESKPLLVARNDPSYFDPIVTLDDIDRAITTLQLAHPDIMLNDASRDVKTQDYTLSSGLIDVARLYQQFARGATIILNQLERFLPNLSMMCRALERELSQRFQANIYLTPKNAQGLKVHYDSHDVFVLQVSGTKHWVVYDQPVTLPYRGQSFGENPVDPGAVSMEFDLKPGDTFYLPRGVMHQATSNDNDSLHITVGVLQTSWTELLIEALGRVGLDDPDFRRTLPIGFAHADFDRAAAERTFRDLLARVAKKADFDSVLDHFADELVASRQFALRGQLGQIQRLGDVTVDSRASVRPQLLYRLREVGESVVVYSAGGEITFPAHAGTALRHALEHEHYAIGSLPGELDDAGKLTLVRRLVREGLVRID